MVYFIYGCIVTCLWYVLALAVMIPVRLKTPIPDEWFRKILHFIMLLSYIPIFFSFRRWWHVAVLGLLICLPAYPFFAWCSRFPRFSLFINERRRGEFKNSLVLSYLMVSAAAAMCWGILGSRHLALACMYAWGIGDGFAALVGTRFGKHKIKLSIADEHKSLEGSAAMLVTSWAAVFVIFLVQGLLPPASCAVLALAGAGASTLAEMITPRGFDTVTCPAAAMIGMLPLFTLLSPTA